MEKEQKINKLWYLSPLSALVWLLFSNSFGGALASPVAFFGLWAIWTYGVWAELKKKDRKIAKRLAVINFVVWAIVFVFTIYLSVNRVLIP